MKFVLRCNECGEPITPARRADFEETGVLFRHSMRDKSDECDMEGDHEAEPASIGPDGYVKVWKLRWAQEIDVGALPRKLKQLVTKRKGNPE